MSHLITKFDIIYTPTGEFAKTWHSLETNLNTVILPDGSNVRKVFVPIIESRFTLKDVDASKLVSDALNEDDETEAMENPLDNWKMILAQHELGLLPLHVPKRGYVIHQNEMLFNSLMRAAQKVLGAAGFEIATIGTLGACSQFFVSISIKGHESFSIKKGKLGDVQRIFLNLISSHNGIVSSALMLSIIRVVCMNTVMASLTDAEANGRQSKFKHTANSLELVTPESFEKSLNQWLSAAESYKKAFEAFGAEKMTVDGFKAFASGVFTHNESDELSTNSFNRVETMAGLFSHGKGNSGETLADGVNAFTEFFTSGDGVGSKKVSAGKKVATANFGRANDWKKLAISIASNPKEYNEAIKRGEMLYTDKLKANAKAKAAK